MFAIFKPTILISFPQPNPALGAIRMYPARHGLTDHVHLVGNLGLILPWLEQADGLEKAFLYGIEIAWYSGRVSR
jgi:hypothetical protein